MVAPGSPGGPDTRPRLGLRPRTGNSRFGFCPSGVAGTREGSGERAWPGAGVRAQLATCWDSAGSRQPGWAAKHQPGTATERKLEQGHSTPWRGRRGLSIPPCPGAFPFPSDISGSELSTSRPVPGMRGAAERARPSPPRCCPERCGWSHGVEVTGGDTAAQKPPPEQWAGARRTQAATPPPTLAKEPGTSRGHPARAPGLGIPPEGPPPTGLSGPKGGGGTARKGWNSRGWHWDRAGAHPGGTRPARG